MKVTRIVAAIAIVVGSFVVLGTTPAHAAALTVTNTADSGAGSLRQAILDANASGVASTIGFAIDGSGVHTITLATGLPTVTVPLMLDGRYQHGYSDHPLIELNGPVSDTLLSFGTGSAGSVVTALAMKSYATGIDASEQITVQASYIGLHGDGSADPGDNPLTGEGSHSSTALRLAGAGSLVQFNVIADNSQVGVSLCGDDTELLDNLIGTDPTGLLPRANHDGGVIGSCTGTGAGPSGVVVGTPGRGNILGASDTAELVDAGVGTTIADNSIGVGSDGHALLQSILGLVEAQPGHGGHVMNNTFVSGALVSLTIQANDVEADHNLIGTTPAGDSSPFSGYGIQLGADRASIHDNDFSHLRFDAVLLGAVDRETIPASHDVTVTANAMHDLSGRGVRVDTASTGAMTGNDIRDNGGAGIAITAANASFSLNGNSIDDNGGLAIDLGGDGPTANDAGDVDTGPNGVQNFPVLTAITPHPDSVTVAGIIDTKPNTQVDVEVTQLTACDPSGYGELGPVQGGTTVITNGSGHASFSMTFPTTDFEGTWWTAIATTTEGTSEASACGRSPGARVIAFVTRAYQQLLGRSPDDAGLRYWHDLLITGLPRFNFVNALEHLPEYAGLFVDQQYQAILDRPADAAGRAYWSDFIQRGGTADDLRSLLYGSVEYATSHNATANDAFVTALYHDILGRDPDPSGLAYWTDLLNHGTSRVTVAHAFLTLPEPIAVAIGRMYQTYLGRSPSSAETSYWSNVWHQYGELIVLGSIVSSDEYYASTPV